MNIEAKGIVEVSVVDKLGREVFKSPQFNNAILNQGLAGIAARSWAKSFEYCVLGSSTADTVNTQTGVTNEFARTNNYDSTPGACGSQRTGNTFTLWRTFLFPTHTGEIKHWGEVGFSWSPTRTTNLFSRAVVPGLPDPLSLGDPVPMWILEGTRIKVKYTLVLTISPANATPASTALAITGLVANTATHNWQSLCLDGIDVNGQTVTPQVRGACMEPSSPAAIFLSSSTEALAPVGSDVIRTMAPDTSSSETAILSPVAQDPVTGNCSMTKSCLFGVGDASGQVVSSLGIVSVGTLSPLNGYVALLAAPYTKFSADILALTFTFSWARA